MHRRPRVQDGRGEKKTSTACNNKSSLKVRHFRRVRFKDRVERMAHRFALANRSRLLNLPCTHVAATSIPNGLQECGTTKPPPSLHSARFTRSEVFIVPLSRSFVHQDVSLAPAFLKPCLCEQHLLRTLLSC